MRRHWYAVALAVSACGGNATKSSDATDGTGGTAGGNDNSGSRATGGRTSGDSSRVSGSVATTGQAVSGGATIGSVTTTGVTGAGGATATTTTSANTTSASAGAAGTACDIDEAMVSCTGSICHGQPGVAPSITLGGGLDLFREDRDEWLIDRPATYYGVTDTSGCADPPELYVDTSAPNDSLIIKKIEGRQSCGVTEPIAGMLATEEEQCIKEWVLELAEGAD